ncbi:MAG: hypothetical protein PVH31_01700 [Ectothiorhodospiraceae bacterium]|jgi:hypothetical protein
MTKFHRRPAGQLAAALLLGVVSFGIALPVAAADGAASDGAQSNSDSNAKGPSKEGMAAVQARMHLRDLQKKLSKIQKSAVENNPELKQQQADLREMVQKEMKSQGVDPEADMARMKEIAGKLRGGDVDKKEQRSLANEYQMKRKQFLKARQNALASEEVQTAQKSFREDLMAAMRKEEPKVDDLIAEFKEARADFQRKMRATQSKKNSAGDS